MERAHGASSGRYVFLDRDGTVIAEKDYLSDPAQVELLPGAAEGLRRLLGLGYGLVLVTNQSGIGRGYFSLADMERVNARLAELLRAEGVALDGVYHCPHRPDEACDCRKPAPGMGLAAAADLGVAFGQSFMIGDKACDVAFGRALGMRTFLVRTGYGAGEERKGACSPDFVADDLTACAAIIAALPAVGT